MKLHKTGATRKVVSAFGTVACLVLASARADAQQLLAEGEVKFKMLSEFFGVAPARGTYLARQEVTQSEYAIVGVLVKGNGDIVQLTVALRDNWDLVTLNRAQDAVREYQPISEPAAPVTVVSAFEQGPINQFVWYAPVRAFSGTGLQVADLSQPYGRHIRKLPRKYVLNVVGGRALRSWPSNAAGALREVPREAALAPFVRNPGLRAASPEAAHYMLAFGDRDSQLRVAYLRARDALPLLWESYKAAGQPDELGALVPLHV